MRPRLWNSADTIVSTEIIIKRAGPGLPTLSFVDLPGIRAVPEDLREKTESLVDYYINANEARKQHASREAEARLLHERGEEQRAADAKARGAEFKPLPPFDFPDVETVVKAVADTIVICCADGERRAGGWHRAFF